MANPGLIKTFTAETAVTPYRIVKHGTLDTNVVMATGVNDNLLGVSGQVQGDIGKRVDATLSDIADIEFGGVVTRGDWLTADVNGKGVTAAPAVGVNNNVIGRAMCSGILGDIGVVMLMGGRIQG
jgi:hypothetical protein